MARFLLVFCGVLGGLFAIKMLKPLARGGHSTFHGAIGGA